MNLIDLFEVKIDNSMDSGGWGRVSDNARVDYLGVKVYVTPMVFRSLVPPLDHAGIGSTPDIINHLKNGGSIGSPFLVIRIPREWDDGDLTQPARVRQHEGTHRMEAIWKLEGPNTPVETHLFFDEDLKARDITPEWLERLRTSIIPERNGNIPVENWFTLKS